MQARSLFDKVWQAHVVRPETEDTPAMLYVDLHLVHEVTSPQAFDVLREQGPRGAPAGPLPRDAGSLDSDRTR